MDLQRIQWKWILYLTLSIFIGLINERYFGSDFINYALSVLFFLAILYRVFNENGKRS